jgi:hypothetical protein
MVTEPEAPHLPQPITIGGREFAWGKRTYVMGIINVTPDSFSGDGLGDNVDAAVRQAVQMREDGADLIDVGGESTRPGFAEVGAEEELRRVIPVIERLAKELDIPISIDTYKAAVGKAAIEGVPRCQRRARPQREPEIARRGGGRRPRRGHALSAWPRLQGHDQQHHRRMAGEPAHRPRARPAGGGNPRSGFNFGDEEQALEMPAACAS